MRPPPQGRRPSPNRIGDPSPRAQVETAGQNDGAKRIRLGGAGGERNTVVGENDCRSLLDHYSMRWGIELSFKMSKQYQGLGGYQMLEYRGVVRYLHLVPKHIRSDGGQEFIAQAIRRHAERAELEMPYIESDAPWENGLAESCFSRLRDELLNVEESMNLAKAHHRLPNPYSHNPWHKNRGQDISSQALTGPCVRNPQQLSENAVEIAWRAAAEGGPFFQVIFRTSQSPSVGESWARANSSRALAGTTSSFLRRWHAATIRLARSLGSVPRSFTPPPGRRANSGNARAVPSYRTPASPRESGPGQTRRTCSPCGSSSKRSCCV